MGLSAVAIGYIGSGVIAAGSAAYLGYQQNQAAKKSAEIAEDAARATENKAAYDEAAHRERVKKIISSQRALYASAGVTEEGSPLLVMEDTAKQGEMDALAIRYGGDVAAAQARSQANLYKLQGKQASNASYLRAGTSLLTSGYKAYGAK